MQSINIVLVIGVSVASIINGMSLINRMLTNDEVRQNAITIRILFNNLQSPTYLEKLLKQKGVPRDQIPKTIQKFYDDLKKIEKGN